MDVKRGIATMLSDALPPHCDPAIARKRRL
jgi:hypothetical protein